MGGVYLQNGVCLLPRIDDHARRLKMLENDVAGMGGAAVMLEATAFDRAPGDKVLDRFKTDHDEADVEFLDKCDDFEAEIARETAAEHFTYAEFEENDADLKKLQGWLDKIKKADFYGAPLHEQEKERLKSCEDLLDAYVRSVFSAHDKNK